MRKMIFVGACLMALACLCPGSVSAQVDMDSIVGVWLLDEGQGDVAGDSSGNGNDGTIVGAQWVPGKIGDALAFDGSSHVEILASATTDDILDGFTYLLWVKPTAAPPNENTRIIERDWHNPAIQVGATNFYGSIAVNADQASTNVRGGAWQMDVWSFVALTYDGAAIRLYVDGEWVGEKDVDAPDDHANHTTPPQENAIWLGSWKAAGWDFIGEVDEVGVFSQALNDAALAAIMDNGLETVSAVDSVGKVAVTWGSLKYRK